MKNADPAQLRDGSELAMKFHGSFPEPSIISISVYCNEITSGMLTLRATSSASVQKIILRLAVVDVKGVLLGARGLLIAGVWGL